MTSSGCYLLLDRQTNKPADIVESCVENILKKAPTKTIYFWNSFQKIALLQWHHQVVKLRMNKKMDNKGVKEKDAAKNFGNVKSSWLRK